MKDNKKFTIYDYLNVIILSLFFIFLIVLVVNKDKLLGSTTDWSSQHIAFPDIFRTLFLENKDFFPDFIFNVGSGQNIYNFAYYGLLNPVIMLSYLLPKVNMVVYIMASTSILMILSIILFYKFLRNHEFSRSVSFISSVIFMCATPILFHLHRHIMFINYMPFLILGLIGIDKYFEKSKSWLLSLSTFLMILMSYYYSVVGIIVFVIYGVYRYIGLHEKVSVKNFFIDGFKFLLPIIIGVLMSCILIVPTFLVILNGRGATTVTITLKELLFPGINLNYIIYKSYGIGLSAISIFALVNLFFKKRENKYLAIILSLILIFPICNYIFNATMYIDAKCLIPFLPLYTLVIALFLKDVFAKKIKTIPLILISIPILIIGSLSLGNLRFILYLDSLLFLFILFLYYKTNYKSLVGISLCLLSLFLTVFSSKMDTLVEKDLLFGKDYQTQSELTEEITTKDDGMYRIANQITPLENTNRIYRNINYYNATLYSSTYNMNYNKFYYDVMNNPMQSRNRVITSSPKNYPFLLLMGHKYLITNKRPYLGYQKIQEKNEFSVYQNNNALPLAYASSNLLSLDEFNQLGYPYNQDAILKNIIVDQDINSNFKSNVIKENLEFDKSALENLDITYDNDTTIINISEKQQLKFKLKKALHNKILYIHFEMLEANPCSVGDSVITINSVTNKLTCDPWKYHNGNYEMDYTISTDDIKTLTVTISKGVYKIKNLEFYTLDYSTIDDLNKNIDEFIFDKEKTKGDIIEGDIEVKNDGYFNLSVPYDKGFTVLVDDEVIDYEKTNIALVGFPIKKGKHHIKIEYVAPGKKEGSYLSITGVLLLLVLIIYEERRSRHERRNIKK